MQTAYIFLNFFLTSQSFYIEVIPQLIRSIILIVFDSILRDFQSTIKMKVIELLTTLTESNATLNLYLHYYLNVGIYLSFEIFQNNILIYIKTVLQKNQQQLPILYMFDIMINKTSLRLITYYKFNDQKIINQIFINIKKGTSIIKQLKTKARMSTKNHTKNQLARISAKINQLKRKYPASQQHHAHTQSNIYNKHSSKDNEIQSIFYNENHNFNHQNVNKQHKNMNSLRQRSNSFVLQRKNDKNNPIGTTLLQKYQQVLPKRYQHTTNSKNQDKYNNFLLNENKNSKYPINTNTVTELKQSKANINKAQPIKQFIDFTNNLQNKQNQSFTDQINLNNKSFNQYKKQLTDLKRQILSSLDFQNYQVSNKNKASLSQKIESIKLYKKESQVGDIEQQVRDKMINQLRFDTNQNQINKNFYAQSQSSNRKGANQQNITFQQQSNHHTVKQSYNSALEQKDQPAENFILQKELSSKTFQIILQKIQTLQNKLTQSNQQKLLIQQQLKNLTISFEQHVSSHFPYNQQLNNPFDMKLIQLQNQSITKIDKQLHKQIDCIYFQINKINSQMQSYSNQKLYCTKEIESSRVTQATLQQIKQKCTQMQSSQSRIKQYQLKIKRQLFDIRNQIQLLNQKLIKSDYTEKCLLNLLASSNKENSSSTKENHQDRLVQPDLKQDKIYKKDLQLLQRQINEKVKVTLFSELEFMNNQLKSNLEGFIKQMISSQLISLQKKMSQQYQSLSQRSSYQIESLVQKKTQQQSIVQQAQKSIAQIRQNIAQISKKTSLKLQTLEISIQNRLNFQLQKLYQLIKQLETKMISYSLLIENLEEQNKESQARKDNDRNQIQQRLNYLRQEIFNVVRFEIDNVKIQLANLSIKQNHMNQNIKQNNIIQVAEEPNKTLNQHHLIIQQSELRQNSVQPQSFVQYIANSSKLDPLQLNQIKTLNHFDKPNDFLIDIGVDIKNHQTFQQNHAEQKLSSIKKKQCQLQMPQQQNIGNAVGSSFLLSELVKNSMTFSALQF